MSLENLQKELEGQKMLVKNVNAQLQAMTQMFNDTTNSNLQTRATIILLQQNNIELLQQKNTACSELEKVRAELETLRNVIEAPADAA